MDEGQIRRYQPLMISGGNITQKVSGTAIKLLGADADILSLGDATHEGGDIKIYRNGSGDLQLSLDADAALNAKALDIYGGVVAQNFLTVGQAALDTDHTLYVSGTITASGVIKTTTGVYCNNVYVTDKINARILNQSTLVSGDIAITDAAVHEVKLQLDASDIIVAQATGDGAGGIVNKAVGLYGVTPAIQAAHIADPAENIAANNAAIDAILVALENIGITASA